MDEEQEEDVNGRWLGKLINLNAPLLSTRRTNIGGINRLELPNANSSLGTVSWDICDRIPFSWEQIPGKPKSYVVETTSATAENESQLPPPKPPPGRWVQTQEEEAAWECNGSKVDYAQGDYDGDVDEDEVDDNDDDDISWNGLDIFSLAQSVDTVETGDKARARGEFTLRGGNLEKGEDLREGISIMNIMASDHSPNFMIQRFLPDAKALAASSALTVLDKENNLPCIPTPSNNNNCTSRTISLRRQSSFSSSKGCGLDIFFPWAWRAKPKSAPRGFGSVSKLQWSRGKIKW